MDVNTALAVLGAGLGTASFVVTMVDRRHRRMRERRRGAVGVSGHWDMTSNTLIVRNDGPLPVVITGVRFIPMARLWPGADIHDRSPLGADFVLLDHHPFLRPGEELVLDCKRVAYGDDTVHGYEKLVVRFTDHEARIWESCEGELVEAERFDVTSLRFRRQYRRDHMPWMPLLERALLRRAVLEAAHDLGGPLRWARALDWLYGWRAGAGGPGFPLGQPCAWHFGDLQYMIEEPYLSETRSSRPVKEWLADRRRVRTLGTAAQVGPGDSNGNPAVSTSTSLDTSPHDLGEAS